MAEDRLADINDRVGVAVNGVADRARLNWSLLLIRILASLVCSCAASISQLTGMTRKDQSVPCINYRRCDRRGDPRLSG